MAIVDTAGDWLSLLAAGDGSVSAPNYYFAVGRGDPLWDGLSDRGKSNELPSVTVFQDEFFRKDVSTLGSSGWEYIDDTGAVVAGPTDRIVIHGFLDSLEATGPSAQVREVGIFAGNASGTTDSGILVSYVIVPVIDRSVSPVDIPFDFRWRF